MINLVVTEEEFCNILFGLYCGARRAREGEFFNFEKKLLEQVEIIRNQYNEGE